MPRLDSLRRWSLEWVEEYMRVINLIYNDLARTRTYTLNMLRAEFRTRNNIDKEQVLKHIYVTYRKMQGGR